MRIIRLSDLPSPLSEKSGWPWDLESESIPELLAGSSSWPRISIVTPSLNQGEFLEETIRSVLLQGYPNLEYIVMDGGSMDDSIEILRRYDPYLDYWVSTKDEGQARALMTGFGRATGSILGFVNSDDVLLPGALACIGQFYVQHPEVELVVGKSVLYDSDSRITYRVPGLAPTFLSLLFWGSGGFNQPASFWRREALQAVGGFDSSYRFSFDYDMYLRLTRRKKAYRINRYLAAFRVHPASKTSTIRNVQRRENRQLGQNYGVEQYSKWIRKFAWLYFMTRYFVLTGYFRLRVWLGLDSLPRLNH